MGDEPIDVYAVWEVNNVYVIKNGALIAGTYSQASRNYGGGGYSHVDRNYGIRCHTNGNDKNIGPRVVFNSGEHSKLSVGVTGNMSGNRDSCVLTVYSGDSKIFEEVLYLGVGRSYTRTMNINKNANISVEWCGYNDSNANVWVDISIDEILLYN